MHDESNELTEIREISENHKFDQKRLEQWLREHILGYEGPLTLSMFKGGQSNPTYKLITSKCTYVMRAKPGPSSKLLPSAHAIEREFRVMSALRDTKVPVPKMMLLCEDESVIGRAFYIMEYMPGRVFWDQSLPAVNRSSRRDIYLEMNRIISELHCLKPSALGLSNHGKSGNYFERQINRWTKQYRASITEPIPEMEELINWFPANIPASARDESITCIVHGDFRLDNVMFNPKNNSALAVLDWELSTLGHPLADFSYHCMSWHIPPGTFRGIAGLDLEKIGIPSEHEYIALYCAHTGLTTPAALRPDWNFYLAYNMFRLASILQGIGKRIEAGTASSAQAILSAAGAKPMARNAWKYAQK